MHLGEIGFVFCALVSSLALGARREEDLDGGSNGQEEPDRRLRLRRPCGARRTCDLRSQFCDEVLGECASCADDCHPGRIRGDAVATNECRVICEHYYKHLISKRESRDRGLIDDHHDDSDGGGDDADDGDAATVRLTNEEFDDVSLVDKLSRRELRLLIQLELLKTQSTISPETVLCTIIVSMLLVAFIWFRLFANKDEESARLMAVGSVKV